MKSNSLLSAAVLSLTICVVPLMADPPKFGTSIKAGPISVSKDGTQCYSIPFLPITPVACENKRTGETSAGVGIAGFSLSVGGKGPTGSNNFIKIGAGLDTPVTSQVSVKIPSPSYTRSGITTGVIKTK